MTRKLTAVQLNYLITFMKANPTCALGRARDLHSRVYLEKQWTHLTETLNALRGPSKTVAKWKQTWRDIRNNTKKTLRNKQIKGIDNGEMGNDGTPQKDPFPASAKDDSRSVPFKPDTNAVAAQPETFTNSDGTVVTLFQIKTERDSNSPSRQQNNTIKENDINNRKRVETVDNLSMSCSYNETESSPESIDHHNNEINKKTMQMMEEEHALKIKRHIIELRREELRLKGEQLELKRKEIELDFVKQKRDLEIETLKLRNEALKRELFNVNS